MSGPYGFIVELSEDAEVLLSVPHLQTEATLVLAEHGGHYVIGWRNWNGRRPDGSMRLRWAEHMNSEGAAHARFHTIMEKGPARFKTPKQRDPQYARFWRWWHAELMPAFGDEGEMKMPEIQTLVHTVWMQESKRSFPIIDVGRGISRALYYPNEHRLSFPKRHRHRPMVLAMLTFALVSDDRPCGPAYVRKVVDLYEKHLGRSRFVMLSELAEYKVEVKA